MAGFGLRNRLFLGGLILPSAGISLSLLGAPHVEAVTAPAQAFDNVLEVLALGLLACVLLGLAAPSRKPTHPRRPHQPPLFHMEPPPWKLAFAMAAVAGFAISLSIAFAALAHIRLFGRSMHTVGWALLAAVGCIGAMVAARYTWKTWDRLRSQLSGQVSVAAFLTPTVLLAGLQFWTQNAYLPGQLEASIGLAPSLAFQYSDEPPERHGTATYALSNEGAAATLVILSAYRICFRSSHVDVRPAVADDPDCWQGPRPVAGQSVVEASSSFSHRWTFTWPEEATVAHALAKVAYARADRLRLGAALDPPPQCAASSGTTHADGIEEAYRLLAGSRSRSLVSTEFILAYGPGRQGGYTYWITSAANPTCERSDKLLERFGVREMDVVSREWIPEREEADAG